MKNEFENKLFPWKELKLKQFKTSDNAIIHYYHQSAKTKSKKIL